MRAHMHRGAAVSRPFESEVAAIDILPAAATAAVFVADPTEIDVAANNGTVNEAAHLMNVDPLEDPFAAAGGGK